MGLFGKIFQAISNGEYGQRGHGRSHGSGHHSNRDNTYRSGDGGKRGGEPCRSCGATLLPSANFCAECGTSQLTQICSGCSNPLQKGTRFCTSCGKANS